MLNLVGVIVLIRYRALVSLMFVLLLLEHLCRRLVFIYLPIERADGSPGSLINLAFVGVMVAGLVLSLWQRADRH